MPTLSGAPEYQIMYYSLGSTLPAIYGCVPESLVGIDITGYSISMDITQPGGNVVNVPGTVTDGPQGEYRIPASDWPNGALLPGYSYTRIRLVSPTNSVTIDPRVALSVSSF